MTSQEEKIMGNNQCVICYREDKDVTHKCTQCRETWLCGSCVAQMQENGQAKNCPVCKKGSPWCNNLPVVIEAEPQRNRLYYTEKIEHVLWKIMLGIMTACVCWLIGYLFSLANEGEMRQTTYPLAMTILIYMMIGFMILGLVTLVMITCGLCCIGCLSLGIPQENL